MFRRYLAPSTIGVLNASRLWTNLCADPELQPEIRDGSVTVYYRGGALLRDLRVHHGQLTADVQPKYVPMPSVESKSYIRLSGSADQGLLFTAPVIPVAIGLGESSVLRAYKDEMKPVLDSHLPEGQLVQRICTLRENQIVDQEIAFQEPGEPRDKIDICHFDDVLEKLVFVEVKRIEDDRLLARRGSLPKVIEQLRAYCVRLDRHRETIRELYRRVVDWKRELGLEARVSKVPRNGPIDLLDKPVLLIGNCSDADVEEILAGKSKMDSKRNWAPLMDRLNEVAAGLLLCGKGGRSLSLVKGRQTIVFD